MTLLNDLPTIIDEAGIYRTRSGDIVRIHEVNESADTTTSFDAKGTIRYLKEGNVRYTNEYNIWHVSGRLLGFAIYDHDIVSKATLVFNS